jgi:hypothetical protein
MHTIDAATTLQQSTVVRPVQQGLALARSARDIARLEGAAKLRDMTADGLPAADLPLVLARHPPARIVAAVPLEPAARVVWIYPALGPPDTERLAGVDAEAVARRILALRQARPANQLLGNSLRQSVMYLPPKTPSANISGGVRSGRNSASKSRPAGAVRA